MDNYGYYTTDGNYVLAASIVVGNTHSNSNSIIHDLFDLTGSGLGAFNDLYYPIISSSIKSHYVYEAQKWLYNNLPNYKRISNSHIYRVLIPKALKKGSYAIGGFSAVWSVIDICYSGEVKASDGLNAVFTLSNIIPLAGSIISGIYTVSDLTVLIITDKTIGEHLDAWIEEKYNISSLKIR